MSWNNTDNDDVLLVNVVLSDLPSEIPHLTIALIVNGNDAGQVCNRKVKASGPADLGDNGIWNYIVTLLVQFDDRASEVISIFANLFLSALSISHRILWHWELGIVDDVQLCWALRDSAFSLG